MSTTVRQRLKLLRQQMAQHGIDAYHVPGTDPHHSEYLPDYWKRREWLSGFGGSAGDMVVTRDQAGLWTDGRYHLQASQQLRGSTIKLFCSGSPGVASLAAWVAQQLQPGQVFGVDPRLMWRAEAELLGGALTKEGVQLRALGINLVDAIWTDRPAPPQGPISSHSRRFAGETTASKLKRLRAAMRRRGVDVHVVSTLDAIAWLFNIRGRDVPFNPVAIAHAIISSSRAVLFCQLQNMPGRVRRALQQHAELRPYHAFDAALAALGTARKPSIVWVDDRSASLWLLNQLGRCALVIRPSAVTQMKSRKNAAEIAGLCAAHQRDGVALVRFLAWLERAVAQSDVTEISASEQMAALRVRGLHFRGPSFATIAAYGPHGAIVHYCASRSSDARLRPSGIFLIDSGGHYLDGTTDVTRTVLLGGRATAEQRERFTRVLKGHIAVAACRFPQGTSGRQLDSLARQHLWQAGLDYAHGTGHGVGAYLSVHEGPHAISPRDGGGALEPGNVLSDEPAYYQPGQYGIRIESLLLVVPDEQLSQQGRPFLRFDVLTLCPIDTNLIEPRLLGPRERAWLNTYHRHVARVLGPLLGSRERAWLRRATRAI